ncbi:glycoside hydrolase family 49 protein [Hyaloscypha variabilis F]|uniref:Glycoside hydrolase family 49 protein n=1 Tax=Hyaloscypha variabilis (strain UAMH 11265 / GT02V1 / F) TaxID=1149755 RepID=A0A2J6S5I2_HYAVF|nr:glycoside hydrolase family 49 protein [Hyaloscypha variabilis F]
MLLVLDMCMLVAFAANTTASLSTLKTWWHATGEINTKTPVQNGNVRQSHIPSTYYNSFVYETIPRNGNGQICIPVLSHLLGFTMAWTQFLFAADVIVKVSRLNGAAISASNVIIRPSNLKYTIQSVGGAVLIAVPHTEYGTRFSVELQDDLWTYRNAGPGENSYYVQDVDPNGPGYVESYTNNMPIDGVEPRNALLIFASPFPSSDKVPNDAAQTITMIPGRITGLNTTNKPIAYFGPGVYWCTGTDHMNLSPSVTWVYFAPGAYVKGAVQCNSSALSLKATGFGVLSGEQYVYQANVAQGHINVKSDADSLHMWRGGTTTNGQTWTVDGVTLNAPPFNSMDFYGPVDTFTSDYKQVGAFFGQTDGLEMYPSSHVRDIFYHAGDDVIKTYYSNILAERITVWKTNNAPIIQFGWYQRNLTNITVDHVNVIHNCYQSQEVDYPRALIGSAASYLDVDSTSSADTYSFISNYTMSNWWSEGISPALVGVNPLSNIDTMLLSNIWIEQLANDTTQVDMSTFRVFTDASNGAAVQLGSRSPNNLGLTIQNYYVGSTHITFAAGNWDSFSLGRLNIDGAYAERWDGNLRHLTKLSVGNCFRTSKLWSSSLLAKDLNSND